MLKHLKQHNSIIMKEKLLHRKRVAFAVLFTLLLSVAGVTNATAQSFTVGNLNYSLNDDGASVTVTGHVDGQNATGELVIPESVELYGTTYFVTAIGNGAFSGCDYLTGSLVIPNSIITIGEWAFQNCFNLNGSLTIGNSVVNIEVGAFRSCNFTGELTIPASVKRIGYWAFGWNDFTILNYNATYVNFLDSEWLIGCSSFTTLNIGENVQMIPNNFVAGNVDFTNELIIPNSVTSIGANSFNSCTGFTGSLSIPNSVTSIGENAFNGCSGFTGSLSIPNSVSGIGTNAFSGCSGFYGTLTIGNSVTQIGNSAFFGACENFTSFNVLAETPPALGTNVFLSVSTDIPVTVPCGTLDAYQNASGWSSFTNIQQPNLCMWEITATAIPINGGIVSGSGIYEQGQTCTLTATPNEDYAFVNWTEDGVEISTEVFYSFTVTSNRNIVANFKSIRYYIWVDVQPEEGGTVNVAPNRSMDRSGWIHYDDGSHATDVGAGGTIYWGSMFPTSMITGNTLTRIALYETSNNTGTITLNVYTGGDTAPGTLIHTQNFTPVGGDTFHIIMLSSPVSIDPLQNLWITFYQSGDAYPATACNDTGDANNRWVSIDGVEWLDLATAGLPGYSWMIRAYVEDDDSMESYLEGETCTLTAMPNEGWEFYNWLENGTVVSTDVEYSFTVTSNRSLVARFRNLNAITFADPIVEAHCVELWDTDGDGYLSFDEAAAVTSLNYAFRNWSNITSFDELQYFTGLTYINDWEMSGCGNLTSIVLPESLTFINYAAFEYSYSLQSIIIPESVTYIGGWAFSYCYALTSIIMQADTPPSISDDCPFCSTDMGNVVVTVPCGATSSYQNAYIWGDFGNYQEPDDCIYEIMATVNHEEAGTVSGVGSYQKGSICTLVAIPNEGRTFVRWLENGQEVSTEATYTFTVMGERNLVAAFMALTDDIIVFADVNVKNICVNNWDTDSDGELTYDEAADVMDLGYAFYYNQSITSFDELQYFTGLDAIGYDAFYECTSLTSIVIPEGVTLIDSYAFYDCYNLVSVNIPDGVVWIGEYAFYVCGLLGELTLPEPLEYVGEYAFFGCDGITTVNYNAVNCQTMGSAAKPVFYDCAFTHLNIGANVQNIPNFAFKRCFMITDMTVAAVNPPTIYSGTFGMVSRSIPVSVPYGSGDTYRNTQYWEEFFNIVEVYFNDVQVLQLSQGWNWVSLSIEAGDPVELLQMLEAALGDNAVQIQSFDDNTEFDGEEWFGGLDDTGISNAQMYMIEVVNDCTVELQGTPANPADYEIYIEPGQWNWIGFPCTVELGIAEALANFEPEEADQIQAGNIMTEFDGEEWFGDFETLVPGQGYMYFSNSSEPKILVFSTTAKGKSVILRKEKN